MYNANTNRGFAFAMLTSKGGLSLQEYAEARDLTHRANYSLYHDLRSVYMDARLKYSWKCEKHRFYLIERTTESYAQELARKREALLQSDIDDASDIIVDGEVIATREKVIQRRRENDEYIAASNRNTLKTAERQAAKFFR